MAYDSSKWLELNQIILSTDEDKIAIYSYMSTGGYHKNVYNFDGEKAC